MTLALIGITGYILQKTKRFYENIIMQLHLGGFPKTLKPKNFSFEQTSLIYLPQTLFNNCLQERHVLEVCGCAGIPFANCINFMLQSCLGIWIFGKIIHSETERM